MVPLSEVTYRIKYYFILNRKKLGACGIYQFFYTMYKTYYRALAIYYSIGEKNVVCPACGYTGRRYVRNTCPLCWSGARHRLLALYVKNGVRLPADSWILDIAPSISTDHIFDDQLYPNRVSMDLDSPAAQIHMDLTDLGIKDDTIDFIVCYHVLEHIKNDTRSMQEIYRVLSPGGKAILQVPFSGANGRTFESDEYDSTDRAMNMKLYGHPTHVRRYGKIDFLTKLRFSGFDVHMDNYVNTFSDCEVTKYGLDKKEILFVCAKREAN